MPPASGCSALRPTALRFGGTKTLAGIPRDVQWTSNLRSLALSYCPLGPDSRGSLDGLFAGNRRQRVIIDAVISYGYGTAFADSASSPTVALLKFGYFTLLAGDQDSATESGLLRELSDTMFIPESDSWQELILGFYGEEFRRQRRVGFDFGGLQIDQVEELSRNVPAGYEIRRIDGDLVSDDMSAHSPLDLLTRGIGFCALQKAEVVCEAYSYTQTEEAIEIETITASGHRRKGLGTATCATLVVECLKRGIEPHWNASNPASVGLAEKLGYVQSDVYDALFPCLI